jgi:hypothetical protein
MFLNMIQETLERTESSRAAEQPAMHSDRHHLWAVGAFVVEHVK